MDRGDFKLRSSYKKNNYGSVLASLVIGKRPEMCVELGVLDGYSTIYIANALKFNEQAFGIDSRFYCWDLWDQYEYKHGNQEEVQKRLDDNGVAPFVQLSLGDGFESAKNGH